jgi:CheY-like chemotaxis protein
MKNFLLVDDDNVFNFISKATLEQMHIVKDIRTALNGKEALGLFASYYQGLLPDIILLDINMPIMNGFEFLEAFNQLTLRGKEKIKIIVVTSSQDPEDIRKAKGLGAMECISKPLRTETLLAALQNMN